MKSGVKRYRHCALTLSKTDLIKAYNCLELSHVETKEEHRKKGYCDKLLAKTCLQADKARTVLFLTLDGVETWIMKMYAKHGFTRIQKEPVIMMARQPRRF